MGLSELRRFQLVACRRNEVFSASIKCEDDDCQSITHPQSVQIREPPGDEAMRITKLLFVSILAIFMAGFYSAPLQAQDTIPSSGAGMKDMKPQMEQMKPQMEQMKAQMEQMSTQMAQLQALMKDAMDKMAAADAAMKTHMETEKASMMSQMALQQAVIEHLQTMSDHMQAMSDHMVKMPDAKEIGKKDGAKMKNDKGMTSDQK